MDMKRQTDFFLHTLMANKCRDFIFCSRLSSSHIKIVDCYHRCMHKGMSFCTLMSLAIGSKESFVDS